MSSDSKIFFSSFFLDQMESKSEKKTKVKILKSSDISSSRFCATRPKGWRPRENFVLIDSSIRTVGTMDPLQLWIHSLTLQAGRNPNLNKILRWNSGWKCRTQKQSKCIFVNLRPPWIVLVKMRRMNANPCTVQMTEGNSSFSLLSCAGVLASSLFVFSSMFFFAGTKI